MFMMASYFLVFYLSTIYDPNDLTVTLSSFRVAKISSILSACCPVFSLSPYLFCICSETDLMRMH
jgi:hypothetical protein